MVQHQFHELPSLLQHGFEGFARRRILLADHRPRGPRRVRTAASRRGDRAMTKTTDADSVVSDQADILATVAASASRTLAIIAAVAETQLTDIDDAPLANILSMTRKTQDAVAHVMADLADKHGVPGLALAWRLIAGGAGVDGTDYVAQAIRFLARAQESTAPIARERLRAWKYITREQLEESGDDYFAAAAAYCQSDENSSGNEPGLPVRALLENRWDDAFSKIAIETAKMLERVGRTVPRDLCGSPYDDERNAWQKTAEEFADALLAIGRDWSGELSIAWRMLLCEPSDPRPFGLVLPQLRWMSANMLLSESDAKIVKARLRVWHDAAAGLHRDKDVSVFRIAAVKTRTMLRDDEAKAEPIIDGVDPSLPHVVVLKEFGANKKSLDREWKNLIDKRVALVVARDVAAITATLRSEYPHAWREIWMLVQDLRDDKPIWMRPVILLGDPGCGKSRLVRRLAELLSIYVNRFDAASAMDGMFAGVNKGWSSAQSSVPAGAVLAACHANPIVMIDEIEKAGTSVHNGSLWNALTPLLERETSSRYRDKGIDCELDLSHVSYIATANAVEPLPAPLRDRFRIIRIPSPTIKHLPALAANVMRDIARDDEERAHEPALAPDELAIIGRAWERERFSMRKLQRLISATLEARDRCAMRH
ncbi:MAG: AAA family ATPase [Rhizobiales bacterium]|nr:AAA family ATPase [Hyphomicrobiales bacterium]MBN8984436.1 AAA family ATPase [Hyphomicrobiales bacterium]